MHAIAKWLKARWQSYAFLVEYFRAVAQQWQEIVSGPGVVFVAYVMWSMLGNPPLWFKLTAIALALFLAGYHVWRAERIRLIPGLEFGDARVIPTPTTIVATGAPGARRVVGQVLIKLRSPSVRVANATGQLLRVWKWSHEVKDWTLTDADEPHDLLWSVIDQPVRMIDTDQRLCVFNIDEDKKYIEVWASPRTYRTQQVFENSSASDIFKLDISVRGENCPAVYRSFKVHIGEQWDHPIFGPVQIA